MNISQVILILSFGLLMSCSEYSAEITPEVTDLMETSSVDELIPVIIRFQSNVDIAPDSVSDNSSRTHSKVQSVRELKEKSFSSQKDVLAYLKEVLTQQQFQSIKQLWIINAIAVTLPAGVLEDLSHDHDVKKISLDAVITPETSNLQSPVTPEWNLTAIGADVLWEMGFTGQNVVIGTMDTGVDILHQDLASRWRGGDNSWFDPFGEHSVPVDKNGHGTQTMGVAIGGDAGGTSIGVAPGASWISVKIFNDAGSGSVSALHQGFQWMLDPDNDPATDDAPDVVNNSWNLQNTIDTCNTEFQTDINTLRNAGIAVVFSAGNTGPAASSSISPANNAGSISTGSVDASLNVVFSSGRGPSACDGGVYPLLSAPGFNIRTADLTFSGAIPNSYTNVTGTSFAVAHVAGAFALLKSAFVNATVDDIETALIQSAVDVGASGSDNDYGWGVINIADAFLLLQSPALVPVANDDTATTIRREPVVINLLLNDTNVDSELNITSIAIVTQPTRGLVVDNKDGTVTYTSRKSSSGTDTFSYQIYDGEGAASNVADVIVNIERR